jgi:unsaturated rhamnogalacturonyl hydrolase
MNNPLTIVRSIGDKLIRDTAFEYKLEVAPVNTSFTNETIDGLQFVDFGRTFGLGRPALAYAWTQLIAPCDMEMTIQIEHNDGCKIWLNGEQIYLSKGDRDIRLVFDERSLELSHECTLILRKGANTLLVKSETRGSEWRFYLQPPSLKGAIVSDAPQPKIGLKDVKNIDAKVASLTNWLVVGPFENSARDLDAIHAPEREFVFGTMYPGLDGTVTWTIPKIEIHGAIIDKQPWGSHYNWTYYNGGTAWAMQHLAEVTGESKYREYANAFCDYHLKGIPFVEYQVKRLNALESANHFIIETPLLDFTLAPSVPFVNRLRKEKQFENRDLYEKWVARMLDYARTGQIRLPGHGIYTRITPVEYTTWVDDMFMGIPFLVQASLYAPDEKSRKEFLDDAASQTLAFNTQVWDEEAELYMHARYSNNPVKLPHWSRCNGWAIVTMSEVLLHLPEDHPRRAAILEQFRRHARSLARHQTPEGFWLNVLDRKDSRPEVSGTAIFTFAIARGVINGWLDAGEFTSVALNGWKALETQIESDGTVHNICEGTMCSEDVNYYMNRPLYDNDTHGLFAVLFAGIEMDRLLKKG